jgi:GMP synthase-like glutamine amidotransferase
VSHDGTGVFAGLPSPFIVARYHSLVIARGTLPDALRVTASSNDDGEIMAVEHRIDPVIGVQFHPESAATEYGYALLDRFLRGDRSRASELPAHADGALPPSPRARPWGADGREAAEFEPPPVELVR